MSDNSHQNISAIRDALDTVRLGFAKTEDGKAVRKAEHVVDEDCIDLVLPHFLQRGKFFRAPDPIFIDHVSGELIPMYPKSPLLWKRLHALNLKQGQRLGSVIASYLCTHAENSPEHPVHRLSFASKDAIYIRSSETRMVKITSDSIKEIFNGTDGVILRAGDLGDWPAFSELAPHIESLRPKVGNVCSKPIPGLLFSDLLTTRWSTSSLFSPQQAHRLFLLRVLFMFSVASRIPTMWPMVGLSGDQDSGKSTPGELLLSLLNGKFNPGDDISFDEKTIQTLAAQSTILFFDNLDGIDFSSAENTKITNKLCLAVTGGVYKTRRLHTTATMDTYKMSTHIMTSSRVLPVTRPDLMRRTFHFETEPVSSDKDIRAKEKKQKNELVNLVLENRAAILAEILLRCQNILRAYLQPAPEIGCVTGMADYEAYAYRVAAYEGDPTAMREMFEAHDAQFKAAITGDNPVVQAVGLVIGKLAGGLEDVNITRLFAEMTTAYDICDLRLPYSATNKITTHLKENIQPLATLGLTMRPLNGYNLVTIKPSTETVTYYALQFDDLRKAADEKRKRNVSLPGFSASSPETQAENKRRAEIIKGLSPKPSSHIPGVVSGYDHDDFSDVMGGAA